MLALAVAVPASAMVGLRNIVPKWFCVSVV